MANEDKNTKAQESNKASDPLVLLGHAVEALKVSLNDVSRKRGEGVRFAMEPQTLRDIAKATNDIVRIGNESGIGANFAIAIAVTMLAQ